MGRGGGVQGWVGCGWCESRGGRVGGGGVQGWVGRGIGVVGMVESRGV